jgi:hypothetical protein
MLRKLTEAQTEQIVSLAKSGVMLSRIAKQFRLSTGMVSRIARAHGIKRRPKFRVLSLGECQELRRRAAAGEATAALADAYGVGRVTVWRVTHNKNMERRRQIESGIRQVLSALRTYPYLNKKEISRRTGLKYFQVLQVCQMLRRRERRGADAPAVHVISKAVDTSYIDWMTGKFKMVQASGTKKTSTVDVLLQAYGVA